LLDFFPLDVVLAKLLFSIVIAGLLLRLPSAVLAVQLLQIVFVVTVCRRVQLL
jgi:hypothetical protein